MSAKHTGTVIFRLDPKKRPTLSASERKRLGSSNDDRIDYTDLPSQRGMKWTQPGALVSNENKQQLTIRLDSDVLAFFKSTGRRYQSRINAALRQYMEANKKAV